MDCQLCTHSNRAGARFCEFCGRSLQRSCGSCGAAVSELAHFCDSCGSPLAGSARPADPADERDREQPRGQRGTNVTEVGADAIAGEHKQVSVLFLDVVGSLELARSIGSDSWRELLDRVFSVAADAVHRFGGTVERFTGEGLMAVFGAPVSHEDHARRACLAALAAHERIESLPLEISERVIGIRVGVNSGEAIVGGLGGRGDLVYTASGRAVSLARRIASLAEAGMTTLSAASASLVAGEFELRELGEFELKGSPASERIFELRERARWSERSDRARADLSPFVGREREQAELERALERALDGDGQVLGVVGEPGVGKSRLTREFAARCRGRGIAVQQVRAHAHARDIPFLPVLELWRQTLGVEEDAEPSQLRAQIAERLLAYESSFEEDLPLVFDFLGISDPVAAATRLDADTRRRRLVSLVRRFVHARSRAMPAVTLIEDLHWLDEASEPLVAEVVRAAADTRTLVILTYRPEYRPRILRGSHCAQLALRPLGERAVGQLLAGLLGHSGSLDGLSELIASRAVGNPFFCEELVAALAESGHLVGERGGYRLGDTLEEAVLPATVQATLAARIDRLPEREKELLQVASVVGYETPVRVLHAVSGLPDGELVDVLESLVQQEFLMERVDPAGIEYAFKHPLTHEVAYRSLLGGRRQRVHSMTARALEELYRERRDEFAALVARHYEAAGELLDAAHAHARSARWLGYSDIAQTLASWRKVSELVQPMSETPATIALALEAHVRQLEFGWRLGIGESEAEAHFRAGRQLARQSGDRVQTLLVTSMYSAVRGLSGDAAELEVRGDPAAEIVRLGREIGDPALRIATLPIPIYSRLYEGRPADALALAQEGIELARGEPALGGGLLVVCPLAWCLMMRANALCMTGRLEESAQTLGQALAAAREQGDAETEAWTHNMFVLHARYSGVTDGVLEHARRGIEIAEEWGSAFSRVFSLGYLGHARLLLGEHEAALGAFAQAIDLARESRSGLQEEAWWTVGLAEALLARGRDPEALAAATRAVTLAQRRGNRLHTAACQRVLAEALLARGGSEDSAAAERALEHAQASILESGLQAERALVLRARRRLSATV